MEITEETNLDEFVTHLSDLEKKQIPFATSRALNDVAKLMQGAVINETESNFENKQKWYLPNRPLGIKTALSNKRDLTASVYTKAYFGPIQEEGGTRTPQSSQNLAIPLKDIPKKYRINKPGKSGVKVALTENSQKKPFVALIKGKLGVYRRTTSKRFPIKLMFRLQPSANIKKRWGFKDAAEGEARKHFVSAFRKRLIEAVENSR